MILKFKLFESVISINKRIILTGAPGTGKSSIVDRLEELGYNVIQESARELIEYYQKYEHEHLPWNNREYFQKAVEDKNIDNYLKNKSGFFDRSIVDEIAFSVYYKSKISKELTNRCMEYRYDKVFIFKPWEKIFRNDSVRNETFRQCVELDKCLMDSYSDFGYKPIEVIRGSIGERIEFILNQS
jgi:predicted ATPase